MNPSRRKQLERLTITSAVTSLLGGTAYALARRHDRRTGASPVQPEILNSLLIPDA